MATEDKTKLLIKILVGAAWLDGVIQPEERNHLRKIVAKNNLENNPEIKSLLSEITPVSPERCYQWLEEYLGSNPSMADYQKLLEGISALFYSDDDIDIQEAKLLSHLQDLEPNQDTTSLPARFLLSIKKLYRGAIAPF